MGTIVFYQIISSTSATWQVESENNLFLLKVTKEERQAMNWISNNTKDDAKFLVVPNSPSKHWGAERTHVWFPTLAKRESLITMQGYEWVLGEFQKRSIAQFDAWNCTTKNDICLENMRKKSKIAFTHVFISNPLPKIDDNNKCCDVLTNSLKNSSNYELIYENVRASVFKRFPEG